ncbi:MAG: DUF3046 domain-containing protein [Nocardioidaceae bacterium]
MRYTEFWTRMESALGAGYAHTWAREHVIAGLGERTVEQALAAGWDAKAVWREVWQALNLSPRDK